MKHTVFTTTQRSQSRSWRGIAPHITGMELEGMLMAYRTGAGLIQAPRGHKLTRAAFEALCKYLHIEVATA